MKKLSKNERELLKFARSTALGLISIPLDSPTANIAYGLYQKGFMERRESKLPFCGGVSYWSLTNKGWGKK